MFQLSGFYSKSSRAGCDLGPRCHGHRRFWPDAPALNWGVGGEGGRWVCGGLVSFGFRVWGSIKVHTEVVPGFVIEDVASSWFRSLGTVSEIRSPKAETPSCLGP